MCKRLPNTPETKPHHPTVDYSCKQALSQLCAFCSPNRRKKSANSCYGDISTISEDGNSFTLAVSRKRPSQQTTETSRLPQLNQVANTDAGACHVLRSLRRGSRQRAIALILPSYNRAT